MSRQRERRGASPENARSPADGATVGNDGAAGAAPAHPPSDPGALLLWIVRIGVCLVLTTPLVVGSNVLFPFVVGKALFARSIIELTFAFWIALVIFHPRRRPTRSWVITAFAAWLLVSWIAGVFGVSPERSMWSTYERMQGVFDLAHWFLFALMAGSVFRSAADWRLLFSFNLAVGGAVCAASLLHRYGLMDLGLPSDGHGRIGSTLGNPMYLGGYLAINALIGAALLVPALGPPAVSVARRIGSDAAWGLCAAAVVVHLWVMWLSGTRSALAGLAAAVLVVAAYPLWGGATAGRRMAGAVHAVLLLAVVLGGVASTTPLLDPVVESVVGSSPMLNRISTPDGQDPSLVLRGRFAAAGMRAFLDRPVLGWGPQNFLVAWGRYHRAETDFLGDHAHNKLVEELAAAGALGLLAYLAVWAAVLSAVFRALKRRSGRDQLHLYLIVATLAAYFVQSLLQVDTQTSMMQFSLLVAFAASVEASGRVRALPGNDQPFELKPAPAVEASGLVRALPGAADPPPGRAGRRAALDLLAGTLATPARVSALAAVAVLTVASLAHFNVRLYAAASTAAQAMAASRPWSDRLDDFTRSMRAFPGLANHLRLYLFRTAEAAIELGGLSERDFRRTVDLVAREAERSARAEPQNWVHEAVLTTFHQMAATRDARFLADARRHIDRARELAPGIPQVAAAANLQANLEASLTAANEPEPPAPPRLRRAPEIGGRSPDTFETATSTAPQP